MSESSNEQTEGHAVKDEIGTKVLFEDEKFKVWDLQLEPGEALGMHRHTRDYLLVFIGESRIRGVNPDGTTRFEQDMHDGDVFQRVIDGADDVHDAVNVGDTLSLNIIIEMKS